MACRHSFALLLAFQQRRNFGIVGTAEMQHSASRMDSLNPSLALASGKAFVLACRYLAAFPAASDSLAKQINQMTIAAYWVLRHLGKGNLAGVLKTQVRHFHSTGYRLKCFHRAFLPAALSFVTALP
jgi:hypothetical protein